MSTIRYFFAVTFGFLLAVFSLAPLRAFQTSLIQINDVIGLATELALRPVAGVQYAPGGVAFVDAFGSLGTVAGNPTYCVTVSGGSTPCGGLAGTSTGQSFVDSEVPTGTINGLNNAFTLSRTPNPTSSLQVYRNGVRVYPTDFTLTTTALTFSANAIPGVGDTLLVAYRF